MVKIPFPSFKKPSDYHQNVTAILGPTNTGKTHIALERLLAHKSGIIGFPLRLLARENYERMVKAKGEKYVALITGEEKIIPPQARWFSCTVEAMPIDQKVEFIAIDEIQLCADPDRGHIFTDRMLHARGLSETLFLGAETIKPFLLKLVPFITIETRPRLSTLSYTAHSKLSRLPKRSAIVAFSVAELYGIAELIRRRRGGCAIVMGRLSPRTRNAQIAMYQSGEVDFLVATDAIGMGLNMDVSHVAFSNIVKFDGTQTRLLTPAEMGQIAGRAGRGMKDGTFGLTATCPPIHEETIKAIEEHNFTASSSIFWRNHRLNFTSPTALLHSLSLSPPPGYGLALGHNGSDMKVLATLIKDSPEIAAITSADLVHLLWESCQIPDFRKIGEESHARLCFQVFRFIKDKGTIPDEWLRSHINPLSVVTGDMDTLMGRLTSIRIYAYITARKGWVQRSDIWQQETRKIEDTLSDALHERLTARFVDKRAAVLFRSLEADTPLLAAITPKGNVLVEGHAIGKMHGFVLHTDEELSKENRQLMLKAARRALHQEIPYRVNRLLAEEDEAFLLDTITGQVLWQNEPIASLGKGHDMFHPHLTLYDSEFLSAHHKSLILQRLNLFVYRHIRNIIQPLFSAQQATASLAQFRGIVHSLYEHGGWVALKHALPDATPSPHLRKHLKAFGIEIGYTHIYFPALFDKDRQALRLLLLGVWHNHLPIDHINYSKTSIPYQTLMLQHPASSRPAPIIDLLSQLGWRQAGEFLLRGDKVEKLFLYTIYPSPHRHLRPLHIQAIASQLSVPAKKVPQILKALGCKLRLFAPLSPEEYGPEAPVFLVSTKKTPYKSNRFKAHSFSSKRSDRKKIPSPQHPSHFSTASPFNAEAASPIELPSQHPHNKKRKNPKKVKEKQQHTQTTNKTEPKKQTQLTKKLVQLRNHFSH